VITVVYAVNSGRIEQFSKKTIIPFSITRLANEQLGLYFKPSIHEEIKFKRKEVYERHDIYHIVLVDLTIPEHDGMRTINESKISETIAPAIPEADQNQINSYSLTDQIVLYYLNKVRHIYAESKLTGLFFFGDTRNKDKTFDPTVGEDVMQSAIFYLNPRNKVTNKATRTNFKSIVTEVVSITKGVEDKVESSENGDTEVVISILSDFDHDTDSGGVNDGRVPISQVLNEVQKLSKYDIINQVNLLQFPSRSNNSVEKQQNITTLINAFKASGRNAFLYYMDVENLLDDLQTNTVESVFKKIDCLIAPLHNFDDQNLVSNSKTSQKKYQNTIKVYYPFSHRISHSSGFGGIHLFKSTNKINKGCLIALNSVFPEDDQMGIYFSDNYSNNFQEFKGLKFDNKLNIGQLRFFDEETLAILAPFVKDYNNTQDIHFVIYPLFQEYENIRYAVPKEKVKIKFLERMPKFDALLLGIFSITILVSLTSYLCTYLFSVFHISSLKVLMFWFVGVVMFGMFMLSFLFDNYFLELENNYYSILLMLFPIAPPFSFFFWYVTCNEAKAN